jgi:hypothetical protein
MTRKTDDKPAPPTAPGSAGLVVGGLGGPENELLESGQEEVFSRTEVESGRIEHQVEAGGDAVDAAGDAARTDKPSGDRGG